MDLLPLFVFFVVSLAEILLVVDLLFFEGVVALLDVVVVVAIAINCGYCCCLPRCVEWLRISSRPTSCATMTDPMLLVLLRAVAVETEER